MTATALAPLASALLLALVPAGAAARAHRCPARAGTLALKPLGRVWHERHGLYACTTVYDHAPRARRMGPWRTGGRVAFDGVQVAWTTPLVRGGVRNDRIWTGSADTGRRWLSGSLAVPAAASAPRAEGRVVRLLAVDRGVAWMTVAGDVAMALQDPQSDPAAVGALPAPPAPSGHELLVGRFPGADPASLTLAEGFGDGDECGGVNPYSLRVVPSGGSAPAGVDWDGGWTSTNCS